MSYITTSMVTSVIERCDAGVETDKFTLSIISSCPHLHKLRPTEAHLSRNDQRCPAGGEHGPTYTDTVPPVYYIRDGARALSSLLSSLTKLYNILQVGAV